LLVWEECPRKCHHEERSNDPIHNEAEADLNPNFPGAEYVVEGFILDLAQDRIHHDQEAKC